MKMTKEDLIALVKSQLENHMKTDGFGDAIRASLKDHMIKLQNDVVNPFSTRQAKGLYSSLPMAKMDGDYMTTEKGSILNLKNKSTPWVAVSEEVGQWAVDFAKYLKTDVVSKFLSESVGVDGGYLVPEEFRAIMIMYDTEQTLVWNRATVWPMNSQKISFPKLQQNADATSGSFDHFAGVSFAWTEEGGEKGATEPDFGLVELIAHELSGYTEVTNSLLDDSVINLVNFLTRIFRSAWYWQTDKAFLTGQGGKQPLGILEDPTVTTVNRQTASNVEVADILKMEGKLPAVFDTNSVWFISKQARANLRGQTVSSSSKELVLRESFKDISDGYNMTILGRPALLADGKCSALGTAGDVILGDWRHYYVGFSQDFAMDSSKHYRFRNNRTSLRCSGRVDGQAAIGQAFVILGDAAS